MKAAVYTEENFNRALDALARTLKQRDEVLMIALGLAAHYALENQPHPAECRCGFCVCARRLLELRRGINETAMGQDKNRSL